MQTEKRTIIRKVPGGKMFKVEMQIENEKIIRIQITGDFFIHPEEGLELLEHKLTGCRFLRNEIIEYIGELEEKGIQLIGFKKEDLADAIMIKE